MKMEKLIRKIRFDSLQLVIFNVFGRNVVLQLANTHHYYYVLTLLESKTLESGAQSVESALESTTSLQFADRAS